MACQEPAQGLPPSLCPQAPGAAGYGAPRRFFAGSVVGGRTRAGAEGALPVAGDPGRCDQGNLSTPVCAPRGPLASGSGRGRTQVTASDRASVASEWRPWAPRPSPASPRCAGAPASVPLPDHTQPGCPGPDAGAWEATQAARWVPWMFPRGCGL